ncbi:MAG: CpaF family protein [Candidatus Limnocylindria bacterium]
MAVLRSLGARTQHQQLRLDRTASQQAVSLLAADEDWKPELISLARLRDAKEVELVARLHARITAVMGRALDSASSEAVRGMLAEQFAIALEDEHVSVNRTDRLRLQDAVLAEIVGYGPLQDLILDDTIDEVMVNGPKQVWIERAGRLYLTDITLADSEAVIRIIHRIIAPLGRRCDESSPMVDARLPDGSRVNAIIPPLSLVGPVLTIRKFRRDPLGPADLLQNSTLGPEALKLLRACVMGKLNIIIAGGTGAGKTTLLNVLSSYISGRERIVTIEDAAELRLQQAHIISLETRPVNTEGRGEVLIRDLFRNALRMRPDRIVIGECRGPEALDMLQSMNTGHDGSMTTVHANGPRDALARIETMVLMSGADLPLRAIRDQIASAIDVVVYVERLQDGTRKVTQISEVRGLEGDVITMQDVFAFQREGFDGHNVRGSLRPTGIRPSFSEKLAVRGIDLPATWFGYLD